MKGYKIFPVLLLAGVLGSTLPGCATQSATPEQTAQEIQAAEAARNARLEAERADAARMKAERDAEAARQEAEAARQEAERVKKTFRKSLNKK
ncbi:MAG: hypothetical protein HQL99_10105 [Magnetococcales bacterium]|nr:hypothetical protein [Magnetococcales bacterium]MBF0271265.1 hypothetical protein [Magnetococcales bacterium]